MPIMSPFSNFIIDFSNDIHVFEVSDHCEAFRCIYPDIRLGISKVILAINAWPCWLALTTGGSSREAAQESKPLSHEKQVIQI